MNNSDTRHKNWAVRGFTIVELLIVIVVIAILAAITIVAYNGVTSQADDARMTTTARQFGEGVRMGQAIGTSRGILAKSSAGAAPTNRQEFFEFNNIQQLSSTSCLILIVNYGGTTQTNTRDGASCFPALNVGQVPKYDKKKLYIDALYGGAYTDSVSYSYWSNKTNSWILKQITIYANGEERVEDYTSANRSSLRCDPLAWDYEYPHSDCRYDPSPL